MTALTTSSAVPSRVSGFDHDHSPTYSSVPIRPSRIATRSISWANHAGSSRFTRAPVSSSARTCAGMPFQVMTLKRAMGALERAAGGAGGLGDRAVRQLHQERGASLRAELVGVDEAALGAWLN